MAGSERLAPVDRALLAGFLLGDTRGVPDDVTERFRAAGLTHLTAVSGENVAFVLALFAPLLRRFALRGRLFGGVAVLVFFGTMTRWEPSVLRAIAMAVIALVAGYLGRPTTGLRVLALAAIVLLLVDPFLLHSVGFLLSCGASLGIAVLARPITARLRGPVWMREVLGVTAAAQLGRGTGADPGVRVDAAGGAPREPRRGPARGAAHHVGPLGRSGRRDGPALRAASTPPAGSAHDRDAPRVARDRRCRVARGDHDRRSSRVGADRARMPGRRHAPGA